jgi:hypothetical protein
VAGDLVVQEPSVAAVVARLFLPLLFATGALALLLAT